MTCTQYVDTVEKRWCEIMNVQVRLLNGDVCILTCVENIDEVRMKLCQIVPEWECQPWLRLYRSHHPDASSLAEDDLVQADETLWALYVPPKVWTLRFDPSSKSVTLTTNDTPEVRVHADVMHSVPIHEHAHHRFEVDVDSFPNHLFGNFYKFDQIVDWVTRDVDHGMHAWDRELFFFHPPPYEPRPLDPAEFKMNPFPEIYACRRFVTDWMTEFEHHTRFVWEEQYLSTRPEMCGWWERWLDGVRSHDRARTTIPRGRWLHHFREIIQCMASEPKFVDEIASVLMNEFEKVQRLYTIPSREMMDVLSASTELLIKHGACERTIREQWATFSIDWQLTSYAQTPSYRPQTPCLL